MEKYKLALFVGRFQPLHLGHVDCLKHALDKSQQVVIVIGSINVINEMTDPFNFETRKQMWEAVIANNGWTERVKIIGANDYLDDDKRWAKEIMLQAPEAQAVFGHNKWTNDKLSEHGHLIVEEPGLMRRSELEGTKIRAMMRAGNGGWKLRVPEEVFDQIDMSAVQKSYSL
jgi:nicotinamide-nucleotide adenylyltransferase